MSAGMSYSSDQLLAMIRANREPTPIYDAVQRELGVSPDALRQVWRERADAWAARLPARAVRPRRALSA